MSRGRRPPKLKPDRIQTVLRYRLSLVQEDATQYSARPQATVSTPELAAAFLFRELSDRDREVMGALYMDVRNREIGYTIAYIGTLSRAAVEPRGLLTPALLCNASGLILFHNHPSGDPAPSAEDIAFTKRVSEAAEFLGLKLLDHLIIGRPPSWLSLKRRGCL